MDTAIAGESIGVRALCEPSSKLLKGGYVWNYKGTIIGVINGDARILDKSLHGLGPRAFA